MTTPPASPPSRWPRFLPKQFSIGALLALITVVAFALRWYVQLPEGTITERQANQVKIGQSMDEVRHLLGVPKTEVHLTTTPLTAIWDYEMINTDAETAILRITFPQGSKVVGRVSRVPNFPFVLRL